MFCCTTRICPELTAFIDRFIRSQAHPNVINMYVAFEDKSAYYIVQELAGKGDLFMTVKNKRMSEQEVVQIMVPVMEALLYLHNQGIIHR